MATENEKFYPFGGLQFLRISELPVKEREPFVAWLRGQCCPLPEGEEEGNCAYVHDYKEWVQRGRPTGLAEEIARQERTIKNNPDLPLQFIKDTLVGIAEAKQGQQSVYRLAEKRKK